MPTHTLNPAQTAPSHDAQLFDPIHSIFMNQSNPLSVLFNPKHVAVIGATDKEGSVGRTLLWNLISSPFGGTVYPVNPKRPSVLGIPAYSDLFAINAPVDVAVIVTPPPSVPALMEQCVEKGVKAVIIISAGFKESGPEGEALEHEILAIARKGNIRIVGPNCLGVMNPINGFNATFATRVARSGKIAFISQSGALCTAVLDWSLKANIGFSAFVSVGSMLDVDWGDLIHYLGDDPNTRCILIYMETIGDAESFLSAAREVSLVKPIIVIKPGRTEAASQAAASHTGSLTGSDAVLDAAFKRCGVLRVDTIDELFSMAEVLDRQALPKGARLGIVTNAGGPGVLANDALIRAGGELADLSPEVQAKLDTVLPPQWSHGNPVDVLGDASPERYVEALKLTAEDPNNDAVMVILTPQAMTNPTRTAELIAEAAKEIHKPLLASWMGGSDVEAGERILDLAGIPTFHYPDLAVRAFALMSQHARNIEALYQTPTLAPSTLQAPDVAKAKALVHTCIQEGRFLLSEYESKKLLEAYGIPVTHTELAHTPAEAVAQANAMGYPVVLKLHSHTITHKTDVGGIQLNLSNAETVEKAFTTIEANVNHHASAADFLGVTVQPMIRLDGTELIIGAAPDNQFGPVMLFGAGGQWVEVFQDVAQALPPLTSTLAKHLIDETKIAKVLKGYRGKGPVDREALEALLVRFSQLIVEIPELAEIEINPLLASAERLIALDARVVLANPATQERPNKPAIRPYPREYCTAWQSKQGQGYNLRPIRPEDEAGVANFHRSLSTETAAKLYEESLSLEERVNHQRLSRVCFNDYQLELALVAEPTEATDTIGAIARLSRVRHTPHQAQLRLLVADTYQGQGLGRALLERLITIAKTEGLTVLRCVVGKDNYKMKALCESLGFVTLPNPDATEAGYLSLELALQKGIRA
ncbi:MAG: GNAT family N-acetyltransferase [Vampirovibrionales bacterium]